MGKTKTAEGGEYAEDAAPVVDDKSDKDSGLHVNKATRTHVVAIPVADGTVVAVFPVSVVNAEKFYAEHDKVDA
jgi:hypothetical protein